MIQPKYNPKEALERAKLLMNYDSSKTLTENVKKQKLIKEQSSSCPNKMAAEDIADKGNRVAQLIKYLGTQFLRMAFIDERTSEIKEIIKEVSQKNFFVEEDKSCVNALQRLDKEFRAAHRDWFSEGESLRAEIKEVYDDYVKPVASQISKDNLLSAMSIIDENYDKPVTTTQPAPSPAPAPAPTPSGKWYEQKCVPRDRVISDGSDDKGNFVVMQNNRNNKQYKYYESGEIYSMDNKKIRMKWLCNPSNLMVVINENVKKKIIVKEQDFDDPDDNSSGGGGDTPPVPPRDRERFCPNGYQSCSGTYTKCCSSPKIAEAQTCLGLTPDGKWGPKTQAKISTAFPQFATSFTDADISAICSGSSPVLKPDPVKGVVNQINVLDTDF